MLRACDDHAGHHLLWVKRKGEVAITRIRGAKAMSDLEQDPDMQLRFELFEAGKGYVGPDTPEREEWVPVLFHSLLCEWEKAKGKPEVPYIEVTTDVPGRKRACPSW